MSIFKKIAGLFGGKAVAIVLSQVDQAVAALKATEIGATVAADIKTMASRELSGSEKFERVLANTLPLVVKFVSGDGGKVALKDVEDIGRALVQSTFNEVVSTKAGGIAAKILKLLGVG